MATNNISCRLLMLLKWKNLMKMWSHCLNILNLKIIAIFLGLQFGCTKFCWFRCECDSLHKKEHYKSEALLHQINEMLYVPLINLEDVLLPPLHIKLRLVKNFAKLCVLDDWALITHRFNICFILYLINVYFTTVVFIFNAIKWFFYI